MPVVQKAILSTRKAIEEGKTLSEPLKSSGIFPSMVTQMVSVGEQTGELDTMLSKVADYYEEEVDATVASMMTIMEPVLMVFLGVIIGGIVISMYLPIFHIDQQAISQRLIPYPRRGAQWAEETPSASN